MAKAAAIENILAIDIGGSHVKATILNPAGQLVMDYRKVDTPESPIPKTMVETIAGLVKSFPSYDKIAVGFPGYVKEGIVNTAPNLGTDNWKGFDLTSALQTTLGKPVRVVNDADLQGLGLVEGKGLEMVITLGTGFGTALLMNGILLPHLELAHHPISKGRTYDEYIGEEALDNEGLQKWNLRMEKVIGVLKTVFNYDKLYISGGNARKLSFTLDPNIQIVSNKEGIRGGARLWAMKSFFSS